MQRDKILEAIDACRPGRDFTRDPELAPLADELWRDPAMQELLRVDVEGWSNEVPLMRAHFDKFGARLPQGLRDELSALESRLASANATA